MILDTSALVAVLYGEPEARDFMERIRAADVRRIRVALLFNGDDFALTDIRRA